MTKIYPEKIIETLFEKSDQIPNDVYLKIMNLMKRYYDHGDNSIEIEEYIKTVDPKIRKLCNKHMRKEIDIDISILLGCFIKFGWCVGMGLVLLGMLGAIIYCIVSKKTNYNITYPPPGV